MDKQQSAEGTANAIASPEDDPTKTDIENSNPKSKKGGSSSNKPRRGQLPDNAQDIKTAECPGNPRCKPPADWDKYFPKLTRPKVSEKTGMLGGVVYPNGWFIPPSWKEGNPTLGPKNQPAITDIFTKGMTAIKKGDEQFWEIRPPKKNGYLTWGEATWQWRYGKGAPIVVDLNKLDLSGVHPEDFAGSGSTRTYTLPGKDLYVHGTITLRMNKDGTVSALPDKYNFDTKSPYMEHVQRNLMTAWDEIASGPGNEFKIIFRGTVKAQPRKNTKNDLKEILFFLVSLSICIS